MFFLKFRLEKRDHSSNCTEVLFHFIVICWVTAVCQIVRKSLWSSCFILIFTGEPVKQMSLNVARVWLGEGRILLLLRSLNTKTCYQSFWNIFSWKLFENRIDSLLPKGGVGVQGFGLVQWFQNRTVSGLLG